MTIDEMLDNMAGASQVRNIADEPSTQGAILRSFVQWLENTDNYDPFYHDWIIYEMKSHRNYTN